MRRRGRAAVPLTAALLAASFALPAWSAPPDRPPQDRTPQDRPAQDRAMPPAAEAALHGVVTLDDHPLPFTVTLSIARVGGSETNPDGEVGLTAYVADAGDRARPVTLVVNGGPGVSSAWLQFGAVGPWITPLESAGPSTLPELRPNPDTWLDFTDLVFVDPPGTGNARVLGGDGARDRLWSVAGDIDAITEAFRFWLVRHHRVGSPVYVLGESYGGFRGPMLARALQSGVGAPSGLVLLSPVLDFVGSPAFDPINDAALLPPVAAAARAAGRSRVEAAEVARYAGTDYLADLLRGPRDAAAMDRIVAHLAAMTGLDAAYLRQSGGRLSAIAVIRMLDRDQGEIASRYDVARAGADPYPSNLFASREDPVLDGMVAPLAGAEALLAERAGWHPAQPYVLMNDSAGRAWHWERGDNEVVNDLRQALALDPHLRVLIVHGETDMVTPWLKTRLILDHLPQIGPPGRLAMEVVPGGHMPYLAPGGRHTISEAGRLVVSGAALP